MRNEVSRNALSSTEGAPQFAAAARRPTYPLRIAFIGVGNRGLSLLKLALGLDGVRVPAVCDVDEGNVMRAQGAVEESGEERPAAYGGSTDDLRRLCERGDVDLIVNAGPWTMHAPVALMAMNAGKDVAVEVPAALTIDECWQLVETAEQTGQACTMLENACYGRDSLLVLNMIQKGLLGDPLFAEAGYLHDLRAIKFNVNGDGEPWRLDHTIRRNGNLYPTHPIGPISWWMNVNRGDRFEYLVSMSTKSRSMKAFAEREFGIEDSRAALEYAQGDVNVTLIRTAEGRTVTLLFDTNTPRVKEDLLRLQGTKGTYNVLMNKVFVEGRSQTSDRDDWRDLHEWESAEEYNRAYDSPLWRTQGEHAGTGEHGGMDYMCMYRLITNLQHGIEPDIDVYDAATWSVISPLTERSVSSGSAPVAFPDFTRGQWKGRPRLEVESIV